jgi:hypothetical protein
MQDKCPTARALLATFLEVLETRTISALNYYLLPHPYHHNLGLVVGYPQFETSDGALGRSRASLYLSLRARRHPHLLVLTWSMRLRLVPRPGKKR